MHGADIDAGTGQAGSKAVGEKIHADSADHPHGYGSGAQFAGCCRLVGSLPSGGHLKIVACDSFAGCGETIHAHYEIHVETADNHDRGFQIPVVYLRDS